MLSAALRILATTALGGAAGFFGGLFGVGGGAIAIPLLGLLYHLDQQTAQGTTLVMVVPNVLLGFWRYRRRVGIDLRIAGVAAGFQHGDRALKQMLVGGVFDARAVERQRQLNKH